MCVVLKVSGVAVRAAIPVIPMVPPVVILPPMLIAAKLVLELFAEKLASAVFDPTFPPRVIVPLEPDINVSA